VIKRALIVLSVALFVTPAGFTKPTSPVQKTDNDATLSSDEMELINQGSKAVFTGHVILEKPGYELRANRMTRTEKTGLVEAEGKIHGIWNNPDGGKLEAFGDHGRYDPQTDIAELWTNPSKQVAVNWKDAKGSAHFLSDRAILYVSSRSVRLADRVTGHVVPAP
jgi:lipopolysaccharide export system protein LptA